MIFCKKIIIQLCKKKLFPLFCIFFLFLNNINIANSQSSLPSDQEQKLNILTWNLYMRPRTVFKNGQVSRAYAIVEQLKNKNYDVIVFQEAFDNKSRKIIWNGLKKQFPFKSDQPKHKYFYKISTGIFIISKLPINVIDNIYFSICGGSDCYAVKGAVLVDVVKNGHKVQFIGTHLQSADGKKMTGEEIRQIQYMEIKNKLMTPYEEKGVPQFFAGDLNIPKDDKKEYEQMLALMDVEDGEISGENQFSSGGGGLNDLQNHKNKARIIDYILCRNNGSNVRFTQRCVKIFQQRWSKKNKDLSDHYAVLAEIAIK